jgi:hypothetical protein
VLLAPDSFASAFGSTLIALVEHAMRHRMTMGAL